MTTDIAVAPGRRRPDPDDRRRRTRTSAPRRARSPSPRAATPSSWPTTPRPKASAARSAPGAGPGALPGRRRRGRGGAVRLRAHRAGREDPPGRLLLPGVRARGAPPGGAQRRDRPGPGPARRPDERRAGRLQDPRRHRRPRDGLHRLRRAALRSVNELELVLSAVTPDGLPCAARAHRPSRSTSTPRRSTLTATAGEADTGGFQLWPQVLQGSLPVAVRTEGAQRFAAVQDLARIVGTLQQAAVLPPRRPARPADAFIADDRSGVIVGATTADATSLEAPLKLSSIRAARPGRLLLRGHLAGAVRRPGGDRRQRRAERQVLMLGGWSPGNQSAPRALTDKLVDFLVSTGWSAARRRPAAHRRLRGALHRRQHDAGAGARDDRGGAGGALLRQVVRRRRRPAAAPPGLPGRVISIRRDRKVAQSEDDDAAAGPRRPGVPRGPRVPRAEPAPGPDPPSHDVHRQERRRPRSLRPRRHPAKATGRRSDKRSRNRRRHRRATPAKKTSHEGSGEEGASRRPPRPAKARQRRRR